MSGTLQNKYRPKKTKTFLGNEGVIQSLTSVLNRPKEKIPHVYLLTGPSGCGKTTLARIIKRMLHCEGMDYKEINAANLNGVGAARAIIEEANLSPLVGNVKIYYLDEAHKLTTAAQNALLKILEEPPNHVFFVLATTEEEKVLKTIKTRCHKFRVTPLLKPDMIKLIKRVSKKENYEPTEEIIKAIVKGAEGSPRQALVLLDSVINIEDQKEAVKTITSIVPQEANVKEFCKIFMSQDEKKYKWKAISRMIKNNTEEPEAIRRGILAYLTTVLLNSGDLHIAEILSCFVDNYYDSPKTGLTLSCFSAIYS